jgi:uncharacterized membrane protein YcjF (UPF0283 family)
MIDEGSNERDNQLDADELVKKELIEHPEVLEVVEERKKRKFTWSGLVLIVIGLVVIASGLQLHTGVYSVEGLIVGIGVIVIIVGILRILIGLIKPIVPSQL